MIVSVGWKKMAEWNEKGSIHVIRGPMFSGKSSKLLVKADKLERVYGKDKVIYINYAKDTRYSETAAISSHNGLKKHAIVIDHSLGGHFSKCKEDQQKLKDSRVVVIDEGQFFHDICNFATKAATDGKRVIVGALDYDFTLTPFREIQKLSLSAEKISRCVSVCSQCHSKKAIFSCLRSAPTVKGIEIIGGSDLYEVRCRHCVQTYLHGDIENLFLP
jgi:thymidine kinase